MLSHLTRRLWRLVCNPGVGASVDADRGLNGEVASGEITAVLPTVPDGAKATNPAVDGLEITLENGPRDRIV